MQDFFKGHKLLLGGYAIVSHYKLVNLCNRKNKNKRRNKFCFPLNDCQIERQQNLFIKAFKTENCWYVNNSVSMIEQSPGNSGFVLFELQGKTSMYK